MKFAFHGHSENRGRRVTDAMWLKCGDLITGRFVQRGEIGARAREEPT